MLAFIMSTHSSKRRKILIALVSSRLSTVVLVTHGGIFDSDKIAERGNLVNGKIDLLSR
jgi:hypothetical protein